MAHYIGYSQRIFCHNLNCQAHTKLLHSLSLFRQNGSRNKYVSTATISKISMKIDSISECNASGSGSAPGRDHILTHQDSVMNCESSSRISVHNNVSISDLGFGSHVQRSNMSYNNICPSTSKNLANHARNFYSKTWGCLNGNTRPISTLSLCRYFCNTPRRIIPVSAKLNPLLQDYGSDGIHECRVSCRRYKYTGSKDEDVQVMINQCTVFY